MTADTHVAEHYLVLDSFGDRRIYVFLDRDPGAHAMAEPVTVELLSASYRFRSFEGIAARPLLGQDPRAPARFREFRSEFDLFRAAFLPVLHYRVCNGLEDYHNPWLATLASAVG